MTNPFPLPLSRKEQREVSQDGLVSLTFPYSTNQKKTIGVMANPKSHTPIFLCYQQKPPSRLEKQTYFVAILIYFFNFV